MDSASSSMDDNIPSRRMPAMYLWEQVSMAREDFAWERPPGPTVTSAWTRRQRLRAESQQSQINTLPMAISAYGPPPPPSPPPKPPLPAPPPPPPALASASPGQNQNVWPYKKWTDASDPHQVAMRRYKDEKNWRESLRKARRAAEKAATSSSSMTASEAAATSSGTTASEKATSMTVSPGPGLFQRVHHQLSKAVHHLGGCH